MSFPYRSATVTYNCLNDCQMLGCPGHGMVVSIDKHADVVSIDRKSAGVVEWMGTFDYNAFRAVMKGFELIHAQETEGKQFIEGTL